MKNLKRVILIGIIFLSSFMFLTSSVQAQDDSDGVEIPVGDGFVKEIFGGNINLNIFKPSNYWDGEAGFWSLIAVVFQYLFPFLFVAFLFAVGIGGIKWISSQGNDTKLQSAQKWIKNAVFGFVATAAAFVLLSLISWFFGFGDLFSLSNNLSTCKNVPLYQFKKDTECGGYTCVKNVDGSQVGWACK